MVAAADSLPDDIEVLKALVIATRIEAEKNAAEAARAVADLAGVQAMIAHQKLVIEKLKRELYGSRSERSRKLIDQILASKRLIPCGQVRSTRIRRPSDCATGS